MNPVLLTFGLLTAGQATDSALDRAVAAYAKVRTARATFVQTITNPLLGTTVTARGELLQWRPGRLAVRFTDPAGDRIVADGTWIWFYLPSTNPGQVLRARLGGNGVGTPDIAAHVLNRPRDRFSVEDAGSAVIGGRTTRAVTLVPKDPESVPFARATIWVDSAGLIRQFETVEANEVARRVTLTSLRINARVDPGAFKFVPPPGVKVVDQEQIGR
jgi:outer membrane lipoprotein carrier protein